MKKTIIAISRAYGAHGTVIGSRLAANLGIPLFDKKIIDLASEKSGLSPDYIGKLEENITGSFLFNLAAGSYNMHGIHTGYDIPMSYTAFSAQAHVIQEIARKGSAVIIGRCSDYLLRDDPDCLKVFLYADYGVQAGRQGRRTAAAQAGPGPPELLQELHRRELGPGPGPRPLRQRLQSGRRRRGEHHHGIPESRRKAGINFEQQNWRDDSRLFSWDFSRLGVL